MVMTMCDCVNVVWLGDCVIVLLCECVRARVCDCGIALLSHWVGVLICAGAIV